MESLLYICPPAVDKRFSGRMTASLSDGSPDCFADGIIKCSVDISIDKNGFGELKGKRCNYIVVTSFMSNYIVILTTCK